MKKILFLTLLTLISVGLFAQGTKWESDPAHSSVGFSIRHLMITNVNGSFRDFAVKLTQGKDDFTDSKVEVDIKTASINTGIEARDKHLISADFFDAANKPEITFKSTAFSKTGENNFKIEGDLTMNGVTKPVTLDAELLGVMKDPWGATRAGFQAVGSVSRYDYNLKYNKTLESGGVMLGEKVKIEINIEMKKL